MFLPFTHRSDYRKVFSDSEKFSDMTAHHTVFAHHLYGKMTQKIRPKKNTDREVRILRIYTNLDVRFFVTDKKTRRHEAERNGAHRLREWTIMTIM